MNQDRVSSRPLPPAITRAPAQVPPLRTTEPPAPFIGGAVARALAPRTSPVAPFAPAPVAAEAFEPADTATEPLPEPFAEPETYAEQPTEAPAAETEWAEADFVQPIGADIGAVDTEEPRLPWEVEQVTAAEYDIAQEPDWPMPQVEGEAAAAWGDEEPPPVETPAFPLDAFIVPDQARRKPTGYEEDRAAVLAQRVAARLEELAERLRTYGLGSLADPEGADDLSRVMAAVVAGYLSRDER